MAKKIGIMGGTFDPIHLGHLDCARMAQRALALDEVIFMPTAITNFKQGRDVASATDRMAMCALAIEGEPSWKVSSLEVDRGGTTYTVDTLRALRADSPADVLFFLSGSDALCTLDRWYGADELAHLATFVAVERPGFGMPEARRRQLEQAGFTLVCIVNKGFDISSSEIRACVRKGQPIDAMVPPSVVAYIAEHGLYSSRKQKGNPMKPLGKKFYEARLKDLEGRVTPKRLRHIIGVSQTAEKLAKLYDVNPKKARLAGLLHDWDKAYDDEGIRARAREVGFDVDPLVSKYMARTLHGETASRALAREFPEIPADVIQAIDRHVTAVANMEPLDMVVYVADAIEPNRPFDDVEHIRQQVGKADLEDLFFMALAYWIERIIERGCLMHPATVETWNHYAAIQEEKHPKVRRQGC